MIRYVWILLPLLLLGGCGDAPTKLPGALTDEQKQAIKAEDDKVFDEEGGNNRKKAKAKK